MAFTANGLTPCPGGDCHGIDHAWCAPGRHAAAYDDRARFRDGMASYLRAVGANYLGRHRRREAP